MKSHNRLFQYPVHRPLTELEQSLHLRQGQRLNLEPLPQLAVIKLNSTFLELAEYEYNWRGLITWFCAFALVILGGGIGYAIAVDLMARFGFTQTATIPPWWSLLCGVVLWSLSVSLFTYVLRLESFSHTHYPIRFNRKTRKVYAFRPNGLHLVANWDDLFISLLRNPVWDEWTLMAHVMDKDKKTVLASFTLPATETLTPQDLNPAYTHNNTVFRQEDCLRGHWEFIRRYMEEGPEDLHHRVKFCMPIAERRETFRFGVERLFANLSGMPKIVILALSPIILLASPFRAFAMRTSRVPVWPVEIDGECPIANGDPYAIEGDDRGEKVKVFKKTKADADAQKQGQQREAMSKKQASRRKAR